MTIWEIGMRCVCVEQPDQPEPVAKKGKVYTVSEVFLDDSDGEEDVMLQFVELRADGGNGWAPGFWSGAFRPLSETRLDQFRQHLAPVDRERADA